MIDTQTLRKKILDVAIRGKFSIQYPEESVKLRKSNTQGIFDIPENWKWVKLGDVASIARGGSPRPIKAYITESPDGINWIKIGDAEKNGKYIYSCNEKIIPAGKRKSRLVHPGDFLLTNSMSFGRPYITKVEGCIHDGWLVISDYDIAYNQDFLYWLLSSGYAYSQFCDVASGSVVSNLNIDKVSNSVFPVPPLEEQNRIVSKIEDIFALLDLIDEKQKELFDNTLVLRSKLIELGIKGELTEQLAEDGNAEDLYKEIQAEKQRLIKEGKIKKEKLLPEITDDDIPFDIPDNWKWIYLGELFAHNTGKALNQANTNGQLLTYITTSNLYWDRFELDNLRQMKFEDSEIDKCTIRKGDLLVCEGGDVGRSAIWPFDYEIRIQNHIHKLRAYVPLSTKYFWYVLYFFKLTGQIGGKGIGIQGLSSGALHSLEVPLPPLAVQKRIVEKLDQLLRLCDVMNADITGNAV